MNLKINRKALKALVVLAGFILLGALLFTVISKWEAAREANPGYVDEEDTGEIYIDGVTYLPNKNLKTVLLIGVDKFEDQTKAASYNNSQQSDFLMLMLIDSANETCTALHLNRDTMTEIPILGVRGEKAGSMTGQLALAHTYGSGGADSCRNTVEAVSNLLYGVKIDHYIAFTMDAVPKINDMAGGVTVTVLDDMTSVSPELTEGATVRLMGDTALAYVRTRYGLDDSSNLRRMERQQQYLKELRGVITNKLETDGNFMMKLLDAVSNYMTSDCTANQLSQLYESWSAYADGGVLSMQGEARKGAEFMEFYPDDEALRNQVVSLFYVPAKD